MNIVLYHRKVTTELQQYMSQLNQALLSRGAHTTMCSDRDPLPAETNLDLVISIGGDGTLLSAIHQIGSRGIPVIGINFGHLGFLTAVGRSTDVDQLAQSLLGGNTRVENRTILSVSVDSLPHFHTHCLNEVSLHRSASLSTLTAKLYVDDQYLATYTGDGVIVATPTGSTAYNLSCGGPILTPDCGCSVVTPIAPHTMTLRSIIVPDTSTLRLVTTTDLPQCALGTDSTSQPIEGGSTITITKAPFTVRLLRMQDQSFFTAIQEKLSWGK